MLGGATTSLCMSQLDALYPLSLRFNHNVDQTTTDEAMAHIDVARRHLMNQSSERERSIIPEVVDVRNHLILLVRFLMEFVPTPEEIKYKKWNRTAAHTYWLEPRNTLSIAASIDKIETNFGVIDESSEWCRPAYEYDKAKSELISQYVFEATRFMWTWMSFEHVVDKLCPEPENNRHGRAMTLMQRIRFGGCREVGKFTELLRDVSSVKTYCAALSKARNSDARILLPYFLCKEIRNSMVHAPRLEIEPSDWGDNILYDVNNDERILQIRIATRLILLISQGLLGEYLSDSPATTDVDDDGDDDVARNGILAGVELWSAIKFIHLIEPAAAIRQYEISI